ncbi:restriction endonuclease [Vibrio chagasii]|uniref:restriction endonuclease n=1 Tax=Vibrio chagasii TaxID=170679 RepID=UPI001EFDD2DE|nr:restriction endonuclease [Vibrio chagasii]MCG9569055.1 restriction endonuclease [Vibrio chagasii]MCG9607975.1 restriction endonuclease [Vibrio chagasii]
MKVVPFEELSKADLTIDAIYEGGSDGNMRDDPISILLPGAGNQGGFRKVMNGMESKFVVLYSSRHDPDWPDFLDLETGKYTYYGDNKKPGHELHDTKKKGNVVLRDSFQALHSDELFETIPIFLIFEKYPTEKSNRAVRFRGIAVPGYEGLSHTKDLIAIWKTRDGQRFQNYVANFTVLDINTLTRNFIKKHSQGDVAESSYVPKALKIWWESGIYLPLRSKKVSFIRKKEEQLPNVKEHIAMLECLHEYFKDNPTEFEACAARLYQLTEPENVFIDEVTRGVVDGGYDAIGRYRLGKENDPIYVDFYLEAKCYKTSTVVGVKEVSRLISRIRNRQFGVLVTTSYVGAQAYQEIREDGHPILIISGNDIVEILYANDVSSVKKLESWLKSNF